MMKLLKRIAVLSLCVLAVSGCTKSSITTEAPVVQEPAAEEVVMPDSGDPGKLAALESVEAVEKVELVEEEEYEETMFDWEQVADETADLFGILDQIDDNITVNVVDPRFEDAEYEGLKNYLKGFVKEGAGAGGAMYTALALGNSVEKLRKRIEKVCK